MLYLFLIFQILWAGDFRPLPLESIEYIERGRGPSCKLLKHRKNEREKVVRELHHLEGEDYNSEYLKVVDLHNFMIHQYFLDDTIDVVESVEVRLSVKVDPALEKEIDSVGLPNMHFSLEGPGIHWSSKGFQFPKAMIWRFHRDAKILELNYYIYKSDLCFKEQETTLSVQSSVQKV